MEDKVIQYVVKVYSEYAELWTQVGLFASYDEAVELAVSINNSHKVAVFERIIIVSERQIEIR